MGPIISKLQIFIENRGPNGVSHLVSLPPKGQKLVKRLIHIVELIFVQVEFAQSFTEVSNPAIKRCSREFANPWVAH